MSNSLSDGVDVNARIAGLLHDMAVTQSSREKQRAYNQAAAAINALDAPVDTLLDGGTLPRIPRIGPSTSRIVMEVIESGESATVEHAVDTTGSRGEVERQRDLRHRFLSRAAARQILEAAERPYRGYGGDLQMHSTWSDGTQTLAELVDGCRARGYAYAAVTDHSAGLKIAGGLSAARVREQGEEIARLNASSKRRFRLLRGIEANIGPDGAVDVEPDDRHELDIVVAAPHSGLRTALPQTSRIIGAVTARAVHILGHPRGRKYGSRAGVNADWPKVFRAAARSGVAIELDGDPARQDLDYDLASHALTAGCLFSLNSDAHAVDQLWYVELAMAHAALAGIPEDRIVNCWPLRKLLEWSRAAHDRT